VTVANAHSPLPVAVVYRRHRRLFCRQGQQQPAGAHLAIDNELVRNILLALLSSLAKGLLKKS
jgi:hypothetical protein